MKYIEYKEIFESIVDLTEKADELYKKENFEEADKMLTKRDNLMEQLEVPEDIDEDGINYIGSLKDKIMEKNASILKSLKQRKQSILEELNKKLPEEESSNNDIPTSSMPKSDSGASIFNSPNS